MGIHPKIGITGLPRSGKSAVMEKVLEMLTEERSQEIKLRGNPSGKPIIAGLRTDCLLYTSPSPRDRQKSRMPSSA